MRRLVILAVLCSLASAVFGVDRPASSPKAVVAEAVHDFGKASVGDRLSNVFVVRNEGTGALQILGATADCACVTVDYDKTVAPGASGEVRVVFDTADMVGALKEAFTLKTNDPAAPLFNFVLIARVAPILGIQPGYARYIYVQKEIPGRIVQTLWATDGKDFNILSVKSPYAFLAASFHEATETERRPDAKGKQWRVETVLSPDAPVGPLSAWFEILTDHPRQQTVRFEVSGFVRPVVAVTPASADLGLVKADQPRIGSLVVQVFSTEEIPVTGIDTDLKGLKLDLETVKPGRNYKIHLAVNPPTPSGDFRGVVRVHTASPKAPLIEIPISGRFQ
ncbi:MAG: DUF1573 domain-containing protein [Acidobacteriota bacterium]